MRLRNTLCLTLCLGLAAGVALADAGARSTHEAEPLAARSAPVPGDDKNAVAPQSTSQASSSQQLAIEASVGSWIGLPTVVFAPQRLTACLCNPSGPDNGALDCEALGCQASPTCPPRSEWCRGDWPGNPDPDNCGICNC